MSEEQLYAMRHSLAHIMATAVTTLWPEAKLGVGPVVENGFYYDIDIPGVTLSTDDFKKIEAEMRKVINAKQDFIRSEKPIDEAIAWAKDSKQPYKEELLNDLKRAGTTVAKDLNTEEMGTIAEESAGRQSALDKVSFYTNGEFTDLCRGPHVESTGKVGAFKLMRVAGAYWRGKEGNPQMQRLYGVAFESKEELNQHLHMLEEAKRRDHRKLGQELDLFTFSELVGQGLALWTPRGTIIRNQLDQYIQQMRDDAGFQPVAIPHITKKDLYEKSGHWSKFKDGLFRITTREGHEFAMKPMNCPHHTQIYDSRPRSYRDLPIRYRETTMVYRDEQSGELGGLGRVRGITQDDAHVFCRDTQIEEEVLKIWNIINNFYGLLGFDLKVRLSVHDPSEMKSYAGAEEKWGKAEAQLQNIVEKNIGSDYEKGVGEAAFYGPKIDFMGKDALGRQHQVATIQLDFNQPEGFDLVCANESGEDERIVMIHCAIMGSIERFLSVYIEHTAGKFPIWLAPEQLRIIQVKDSPELEKLVDKIAASACEQKIRFEVDRSNESVGKKIRSAEIMKIPYSVVVGEKELETGELTPRIRGDLAVENREQKSYPIENLLKSITNEAKSRVQKSSL